MVLCLNLGAEDVSSGPCLGEDETVGLVRELGFNVTVQRLGLWVL